MMDTIWIVTAALLFLPLFLRGGVLHNYLAQEAASIFRQAGFETWLEKGVLLLDQKVDFVDLMVQRGNCILCVEIETSARHVLDNTAKADVLGLPLWIVVPNRTVKKAVAGKLKNRPCRPGGLRIYILLLSELEQVVTNYFPLFSPANRPWENKKKKDTSQEDTQ